MGINCIRWADRPDKQACTGWEDDSRPVADFEPEHGIPGCEDWSDKDLRGAAALVTAANEIVIADDAVVTREIPEEGGRIPV